MARVVADKSAGSEAESVEGGTSGMEAELGRGIWSG